MPNPIDPVNTGAVQANSTFVVDRNYTVRELFGAPFIPAGATTGQVTVPDNVILIFKGGIITWIDNCKIIGNNTRIVAHIEQIFGDNITATGSWVIDRAYPQWFGYKPYNKKERYNCSNINTEHNRKYSQNDSEVPDGGLAIRKVIEMIKSGEVFLPRGFYIIKTPIIMRVGIQLVGDKGQGAESDLAENHFQGTVLQSWKEFEPYSEDPDNPVTLNTAGVLMDDSNEYMLYFNTTPDNITERLTDDYNTGLRAGQISEIRDITFYNYVSTSIPLTGTDEENALNIMAKSTACLKGIYAVDALSIENVRFEYFRQAIVFKENSYIDSKRIVNCAVTTKHPCYPYLDSNIFSFDLSGHGDGFIVDHNAIDGWYNRGIRMSSSYGGRISCNIINADCQFVGCKGLTFSNNHMEYGHQVEVICSNVIFDGNFFEKRYKPNIRIRGNKWHDKSVVSLKNDQFLFYENSRLNNTREYNETLENIVVPGGQYPSEFTSLDKYKEFLALKSVSEDICEYDIDIDIESELNLSNVFRYRITDSSGESMYKTGIAMRLVTYTYDSNYEVTSETYEDFAQFNDYSYMLSKHGLISPGLYVLKGFTVNGVKETVGLTPQSKNDMRWMAESGNCEYRYQFILDKQRPLVGNHNNSQLFLGNYPSGQNGSMTMGNTGGILLALRTPSEQNGNHKMLRLYRTIKNGTTEVSKRYVDIPLSGSRVLYDNGINVNGYKWKEFTGTVDNHSLKGDTGVESITFDGVNVKCRTSTASSHLNDYSQWQRGDVLLNVGSETNWIIKVIK